MRTGHQWVPHGRGHHELLLPEQGGGELVTQGVGVDGRERAVELVVAEHCEDALLGVLDHVDGHVRVLGAELRQHAEEVVRAGRIHAPDPQRAAQQPCQLVELVAQVVDLREDAARVLEHQLALRRRLDRAARAPEDLDADLGLEAP